MQGSFREWHSTNALVPGPPVNPIRAPLQREFGDYWLQARPWLSSPSATSGMIWPDSLRLGARDSITVGQAVRGMDRFEMNAGSGPVQRWIQSARRQYISLRRNRVSVRFFLPYLGSVGERLAAQSTGTTGQGAADKSYGER